MIENPLKVLVLYGFLTLPTYNNMSLPPYISTVESFVIVRIFFVESYEHERYKFKGDVPIQRGDLLVNISVDGLQAGKPINTFPPAGIVFLV